MGSLQTNGDLGALVIREEQALNGCEGQRDQAVQMVSDMNAASAALAKATAPRPWWKVWP